MLFTLPILKEFHNKKSEIRCIVSLLFLMHLYIFLIKEKPGFWLNLFFKLHVYNRKKMKTIKRNLYLYTLCIIVPGERPLEPINIISSPQDGVTWVKETLKGRICLETVFCDSTFRTVLFFSSSYLASNWVCPSSAEPVT